MPGGSQIAAQIGLTPLALDGARTWRGKAFPISYELNTTALPTVEQGSRFLEALAASGKLTSLLQDHGAVLFRGFGHPSAETFSRLVRSAEHGRGNTPYEQVGLAGKRTEQAKDVHTANEGPETQRFFLHNEVSHHPTSVPPSGQR
jgi:hypothetical protein